MPRKRKTHAVEWHGGENKTMAPRDKAITCQVCRGILFWRRYIEWPPKDVPWIIRLIDHLSVLNRE